ncbi:MAG: hypothetical protein Q8N15_07415 [Bacillota bacterium]|nr:hypothetical protein [Bacillota bacterium]
MENAKKISVNTDAFKASIFMVLSFLLMIAVCFVLFVLLDFGVNNESTAVAIAIAIAAFAAITFAAVVAVAAVDVVTTVLTIFAIAAVFAAFVAFATTTGVIVAVAIIFAVFAAAIAIGLIATFITDLAEFEKISFPKTLIFLLFCSSFMGICFYFLSKNKTTITTIGLVLLVISLAIPILIGGGDLLCQLAGRKSFFARKKE